MNNKRYPFKLTGLILGAAGMMALTAAPGTALAQSTGASAETFNVVIGGVSQHGTINTYNYYPDVLTIDAGDTVTWHEGPGIHTVLIAAPGATLPPPGAPATLAPSGGSTFNGTGMDSSGILFPGKTYSLKFTKPGVYQYQCGIHPDMVGAVVVQPAGTARPYTPQQVLNQGQQQLQVDLSAGEHAKRRAHATVAPGPHGTATYHVMIDLPSPQHWTVPLTAANGSEVGAAEFILSPTQGMTVRESIMAGTPNTTYSANIQLGSNQSGSPVVNTLNSITTNSHGQGAGSTTFSSIHAIPGNVWFLDLMASGSVAASGQVNYPQYGSLRFYPGSLTVHAGDTVVWAQNDYHEEHTVTFLAPGQTLAQATKVEATPYGGHTVNGPAFFNSGLLSEGQTYHLTFNKPGVYHYQCLLHDGEGMVGSVTVLPAVSHPKPKKSAKPTRHSALTYVVHPGNTLWTIAKARLGSGTLWHEIYAKNRQVIGSNPDVLKVGTVLTLP